VGAARGSARAVRRDTTWALPRPREAGERAGRGGPADAALPKVLTGENASEVLPRFFGTSRRDAKNVVAELAPEPAPTRTVVTAVTAVAAATPPLTAPTGRLADQVRANSEHAPRQGPDAQCIVSAPTPTVVEPKTAEVSRVHLTVPRRLLEKLSSAAPIRSSPPGSFTAST
jgi:hypothetical protein